MRSKLAVAGMALIFAGCDSTPPTVGNPGHAASIALTRTNTDAMRSRGDTQTVSAIVRDGRQNIITAPTVLWSSSAPAIAIVTGSGANALITAISDGEATIVATSASVQSSIVVRVQRRVGSVQLSAPSAELVFGSAMQLKAFAFDARGYDMEGITGFSFSSDNPVSAHVSPEGEVTALFQIPQNRTATLSATLTRDGATVTGTTTVSVNNPTSFDLAALMLSDYVWPVRVPNIAAGISFFTRKPASIDYRITWSAMSGPATRVQIRGPAGETEIGDVLVDINPPAQVQNFGVVLGTLTPLDIQPQGGAARISLDSLATLMCNRKAYVEVRSAAFPLGEIRGQALCPPKATSQFAKAPARR